MSYIERELLLIGVDGCISALHAQAKGDPIQEGAIKLVEATRDYIASLSAADVVEVRHGRWIDSNKKPVPWDEQNPTSPSGSAYCSECGEWLTGSDEYPAIGLYCPNCGALMREIENGEK